MNHPPLQPSERVHRVEDVLDADIENETVLMDIDQGQYFGLNKTGTRIWTLLAEPVVISDLCDQLVDEFNVPRQDCEREVMIFLHSLLDRGLLKAIPDETS